MTLDLTGKKVVVTDGKHSVGRAIAEAVAREEADVVIWLRKCNDEVNEEKVLPEPRSKAAPGTSRAAPSPRRRRKDRLARRLGAGNAVANCDDSVASLAPLSSE